MKDLFEKSGSSDFRQTKKTNYTFNPTKIEHLKWTRHSAVNDYVHMRTNNAVVSNNQSKDLIVLWYLFVKSKLFTPVYLQFPLFLLFAKNCGKCFTASKMPCFTIFGSIEM